MITSKDTARNDFIDTFKNYSNSPVFLQKEEGSSIPIKCIHAHAFLSEFLQGFLQRLFPKLFQEVSQHI